MHMPFEMTVRIHFKTSKYVIRLIELPFFLLFMNDFITKFRMEHNNYLMPCAIQTLEKKQHKSAHTKIVGISK